MNICGNENTKRRRDSITEQVVSLTSWCSAFCEVMNVMDVCNDAKRNFVVTKVDESGKLSRQNSYECDENGTETQSEQCDGNGKNMLNATLLFDEQNCRLNTKKKRTEQYRYEANHVNIELITQK